MSIFASQATQLFRACVWTDETKQRIFFLSTYSLSVAGSPKSLQRKKPCSTTSQMARTFNLFCVVFALHMPTLHMLTLHMLIDTLTLHKHRIA